MKVYTVEYTLFDDFGEILENYIKKVFNHMEDANKYMLDTASANSENFYTLVNNQKGTVKTLRIVYTDSKDSDGKVVEFYMKEREVE